MSVRGFEDDQGFIAPAPLTSNQRKLLPEDFPTGPRVGERLPDFELRDQKSHTIRFHEHRGRSKAALVFYRSAVW